MTGRIVVGIDGSKDSQRALNWALDEARVRDAELVLVHAWEYPISYEYLPPDIEQTHAAILAEEAARAVNKGVRITTKLIEGRAWPALVRVAADSDLLVVGSRGHSRMLSTVLGSVSAGCVHHAPCPVVVVRAVATSPADNPPEDNGAPAHAQGCGTEHERREDGSVTRAESPKPLSTYHFQRARRRGLYALVHLRSWMSSAGVGLPSVRRSGLPLWNEACGAVAVRMPALHSCDRDDDPVARSGA